MGVTLYNLFQNKYMYIHFNTLSESDQKWRISLGVMKNHKEIWSLHVVCCRIVGYQRRCRFCGWYSYWTLSNTIVPCKNMCQVDVFMPVGISWTVSLCRHLRLHRKIDTNAIGCTYNVAQVWKHCYVHIPIHTTFSAPCARLICVPVCRFLIVST